MPSPARFAALSMPEMRVVTRGAPRVPAAVQEPPLLDSSPVPVPPTRVPGSSVTGRSAAGSQALQAGRGPEEPGSSEAS